MQDRNTYGFQTDVPMPPAYAPTTQAQGQTNANQEQAALLNESEALKGKLRSGASWFYWIAALSLINTALFFTGQNWGFIIGLNITDLINYVASELWGTFPALGLSFFVAQIFVLLGFLSNRKFLWVYLLGMALYASDAMLSVLIQDWLGLAFHGLALFWLFGGLRALLDLRKVEQRIFALAPSQLWTS